MSGTAAELVPVREIDDHQIGAGEPGPVTREVQRVFDDALHGRDPRYADVARPRQGADEGGLMSSAGQLRWSVRITDAVGASR